MTLNRRGQVESDELAAVFRELGGEVDFAGFGDGDAEGGEEGAAAGEAVAEAGDDADFAVGFGAVRANGAFEGLAEVAGA